MSTTPPHVVIDGDIICYSVGFASERKDKQGNVTAEPVEYALSSVKRMLRHILEGSKCISYTVYLTGGNNFRDDIATITKYKDRESRKPTHYQAIVDYLVHHHDAIVVHGEEADDAMAMDCARFGHTIATLDKDLNNVEGWHYNWRHKQLYYVDGDEAMHNFYCQLLTGDSTDSIPGLYRMTGSKAAAKYKEVVRACMTDVDAFNTVRYIWLSNSDESVETVDAWLLEIGRLLWMRTESNELWEFPIG